MTKPPRKLQHRIALLLTALATPFSAAANDGPYNGLVFGVNLVTEQDVKRDGQTLFTDSPMEGYYSGMVFGHLFGNGFRPEIELNYRYNDFDDRQVASPPSTAALDGYLDAYMAMSNLWLEVTMDSGPFYMVHPYIGGGGGGARLAVHHPTVNGTEGPSSFDTVFAYQLGAGIAVDFTTQIALTLDYRHVQTREATFDNSNGPVQARYEADSAMLGLRISYGLTRSDPKFRQPVRVVAPVPLSPPQDSDGDGVADMDERCPGTPRGFQVDASGCIVQQNIVLRDINFETNSDRLVATSSKALAAVNAALSAQPQLRVEVVGHTDSIGSADSNLKLSRLRAESVRRYLVAHGASANKLEARGAGETSPVADNDTESGRAENRRVEFVILEN